MMSNIHLRSVTDSCSQAFAVTQSSELVHLDLGPAHPGWISPLPKSPCREPEEAVHL